MGLHVEAQGIESVIVPIAGIVGSVGENVKAPFLQRPRSHDLASTRTLVTLLRPWIRRFTMIISGSLLGGFEQAANLRGKKSNGKLGKWSTRQRVRIHRK